MGAEYVAAASELLDAHHPVVGVSDFGDEIADYCATCGSAVGWREDEEGDVFGHATLWTVEEVEARIARRDA